MKITLERSHGAVAIIVVIALFASFGASRCLGYSKDDHRASSSTASETLVGIALGEDPIQSRDEALADAAT